MHNAALSIEATVSQRSSDTDADLVARAANGDELAFETIMRRHNRLLFRTARSILKNDAETEDTLQEAYLRAWRALAGFRPDLIAYLERVNDTPECAKAVPQRVLPAVEGDRR